jgi:DUF1680 family protein
VEKTEYPFKGAVKFEVRESGLSFIPEINLIVPSWIDNPEILINNKKVRTDLSNGFIRFKARLNKGDQIRYTFKLKSGGKALENAGSLQGYHKYFFGPLLLGYSGRTEIQLPRDVEFTMMKNGSFRVKDDSLLLVPVYHLLKPEVGKEKGFQLQVLFKNDLTKN